jgi:hypothetical protein
MTCGSVPAFRKILFSAASLAAMYADTTVARKIANVLTAVTAPL